MGSRQCIHRFTDEGCVVGRRVGVSPNGQFVACGSESGIVNIYERSEVMMTEVPKPLRTVMNLTTAVDHLQFNAARLAAIVACYTILHHSSLSILARYSPLHRLPRKMLSKW